MTRSSAGESKLPTCKYFSKLHFLRDTTSNRATITNLTLVEPQDGNSNSALNDSSQIWEEEISSPGDITAAEQSSSERVSSYETITSQPVAESALFELPSKASNASLRTRKRNNHASAKDPVDMLLGKASIERKGTNEHDADVLFCKSLIHILKRLKEERT